jgi:hypothetical protein
MKPSFFTSIFLCFFSLIQGQNPIFYTLLGKNIYTLQQQRVDVFPLTTPSLNWKKAGKLIENKEKASHLHSNRYTTPIPIRYYSYDKLAFFCKLEVQLEQQCHNPIKFRLGDVQYVDWLEGKANTGSLKTNYSNQQ